MNCRITLNTFGSLGDLYPFLALALELKKRGYSPVISANKTHRAVVESEKIAFAAIRPDPLDIAPSEELVSKIFSSNGMKYLLCDILFPHLQQSYQDLLEVVESSELMISHPFSFAAPLVAQKTNIPWISTILSPISFFSAYDPPLFNPKINLKPYPVWVNRLIMSFLVSRSFSWSKPIQIFRQQLGLPPVRDPFITGQHSPELILAMFSAALANPQPDWWQQTCQTGFIFYEPKEATLPQVLLDFLDSGQPPIVFTLGSSAVEAGEAFFEESVIAAKNLGERAVLLVGKNRENIPHALLSRDVIAVDYIPHFLLFPLAKAIIHQGGIGTTAQALKSGKPMLVVPFGQDQFDNADRVRRLGVGLMILKQKYNAQTASSALKNLINNSQFTQCASLIKKQIEVENGSVRTCDEIEKFLLHRHNYTPQTNNK